MGLTHLQQTLRILCFNTEWKYAVFWKLNCKAKTLLTWEDAFYNNHEPPDPSKNVGIDHTLENNDQYNLQNPLGLAMEKMSCLVYSIGEGIVGQVALTGKHQWILADMRGPCSWSSPEYSDEWQAQFSAGIRTMVVVPVVPLGVIQLGSLNIVNEDINLVTLIKNVFCSLQNFVGFLSSPVQNFVRSNLFLGKEFEGVDEHTGAESLMSRKYGGDESPQSHSGFFGLKHKKPAKMELFQKEELTDENKHNQVGNGFKQNPNLQSKSSHSRTSSISFNFPAGCELHEALGSSFKKDKYGRQWNESVKTESGVLTDPSNGVFDSWFATEFESKDLLEAVVGNAVPSPEGLKSDNSLYKPDHSLVTSENPKVPYYIRKVSSSVGEPIIQASHLENYPNHHLNSTWESTKVSTKRDESSSKSTCTEQLWVKPAKINKKRDRYGENFRPRPRDRQLIQDRIKELRRLVPNGSKCSIDALLARTIKHMLFLESVTEHGEKLKRPDESRLRDNGMGSLGSFKYQHCSSWAVEVDSQTNVCPIIVKSIDISGEMLVEMLCEECSHFLEIAGAIRGLGLTILKAVTKGHDGKTWACFLVEGQNGRVLHRMDILLPLLQLLKPKTAI